MPQNITKKKKAKPHNKKNIEQRAIFPSKLLYLLQKRQDWN